MEMDGNTKNMALTGMAALCLILGILGALGSTWLVPEDEMDGMDAGTSLTASWTEMDLADMGAESESDCEDFADAMEMDGAETECDGTVMTVTMSFSDICDDDADDEDACDMATGGMIGTIGMWAGILCALVLTLSLALPMAGVDAMDQLPDIAKKIATWGAGAAMLVGMLGWYMMIPESDSETGLGMSGWLAGAAMTIGLGAAAMDQFVESTE